jgi:hypothetical protein
MNMFRDLAMMALIILGAGLSFTDPATWTWISVLGPQVAPYVSQSVDFLSATRPFSNLFCYALALALFMTRIKF